jgi:hypothetical protein
LVTFIEGAYNAVAIKTVLGALGLTVSPWFYKQIFEVHLKSVGEKFDDGGGDAE